jgi:CRP-like cAMP-binding protein
LSHRSKIRVAICFVTNHFQWRDRESSSATSRKGDVMSDSTREGVGSSIMGMFFNEPGDNARRLELKRGEVICEPGRKADSLYCIREGQVRTYLDGPADTARLLEILGPGDWFGIDALTRTPTVLTRAVAAAPTAVWALPVEGLGVLLQQQPRLAMELIHQLAAKLQAAREDAGRLVSDDTNARLIRTLLAFSNSAAATQQKDGEIMLNITHRQLAQAVGAARETVSLALTHLRQQSIVRTGRNRLTFKPQVLRAFAEGSAAQTEAAVVEH